MPRDLAQRQQPHDRINGEHKAPGHGPAPIGYTGRQCQSGDEHIGRPQDHEQHPAPVAAHQGGHAARDTKHQARHNGQDADLALPEEPHQEPRNSRPIHRPRREIRILGVAQRVAIVSRIEPHIPTSGHQAEQDQRSAHHALTRAVQAQETCQPKQDGQRHKAHVQPREVGNGERQHAHPAPRWQPPERAQAHQHHQRCGHVRINLAGQIQGGHRGRHHQPRGHSKPA